MISLNLPLNQTCAMKRKNKHRLPPPLLQKKAKTKNIRYQIKSANIKFVFKVALFVCKPNDLLNCYKLHRDGLHLLRLISYNQGSPHYYWILFLFNIILGRIYTSFSLGVNVSYTIRKYIDTKISKYQMPNDQMPKYIVRFNYRSTSKDNIYIDTQAGRNLLPKLLVADN